MTQSSLLVMFSNILTDLEKNEINLEEIPTIETNLVEMNAKINGLIEQKKQEEKKRYYALIAAEKQRKITEYRNELRKKMTAFMDENFKLHRENNIRQIIKTNYNPSISELDNWLACEKMYDYPYENSKESILKYIESMFVPITMYHGGWCDPPKPTIREPYGIIVGEVIYMFILSSIEYKDICVDDRLDKYIKTKYSVIHMELYKFWNKKIDMKKISNNSGEFDFYLDYKTNNKYIKDLSVLTNIFLAIRDKDDNNDYETIIESFKDYNDNEWSRITITRFLLSKILNYISNSYVDLNSNLPDKFTMDNCFSTEDREDHINYFIEDNFF